MWFVISREMLSRTTSGFRYCDAVGRQKQICVTPRVHYLGRPTRALALAQLGACLLSAWLVVNSMTVQAAMPLQLPLEAVAREQVQVLSVADWSQEVETRKSIPVIAPHGQSLTRAYFITKGQYEEIELEPLRRGETRGSKAIGKDHLLPLPLPAEHDFLYIVSDQGFCSMSTRNLRFMDHISLQEWSQLRIRLTNEDGPMSGTTVRGVNHFTSDGLYQNLGLYQEWTTDGKGRIETGNIPSSEWRIEVNPRLVTEGRTSHRSADRFAHVWIAPSETASIFLGKEGRRIVGKVRVAGTGVPISKGLRGEIRVKDSSERIPVQWNEEGFFTSVGVPYGPISISVRSVPQFRQDPDQDIFSGERDFECVKQTAGISGPQILGTIDVEVVRRRDDERGSIATLPTPVQDAFDSIEKVSLIAATDDLHYALMDEQGNPLRDLRSISATWLPVIAARQVAFDQRHDRIYLLSDVDKSSKRKTLHTFSSTGKQLSRRELEPNVEYRIGVDDASGNLWLHGSISVGDSRIDVIDIEGRSIKTLPHTSMSLCYSSFDQAFWLIGSSEVQKVDPVTFKTISAYTFPAGLRFLSNVFPSPKGGVVAVEVLHLDVPSTRNRIWRFDSDAQLQGCADTGNSMISNVAFIGDEIWATAHYLQGKWWKPNATAETVNLRLDAGLNALEPLYSNIQSIGSVKDGKSVWMVRENKLHHLSVGADGKIRIDFAVENRGKYFWANVPK